MLNNLSISLKLKINSTIIVLGLLLSGFIIYNALNSLSKEYKNSLHLAQEHDTLNAIFINGLLYNSSSGVVFQNPNSSRAKKTMTNAITKVEKAANNFKQLNLSLYSKFETKANNFLETAKVLYKKVEEGKQLEKNDMKISLKAWRDLKFTITDIIKIIKKDSAKSKKNYDSMIKDYLYTITILLAIILFIILIFNILLSKSIISPLEVLEDAMEKLSKSSDGHNKIEIKSHDETALIAKNFNLCIDKIEKQKEEDAQVIHNVQEVVSEIKQGKLNSRVKTRTSNSTIMELVDTLNSMLDTLHEIVIHSLTVLDKYHNENFTAKTTIKCQGDIAKLLEGIDSIGATISTMLCNTKRRGLELNHNSNELLQNVDILNESTTAAAANLEQTAAALEQITSNVSSSTQKIEQMSQISNEVISSAKEGEDLALRTAQSMDIINNEVSDINEAITVIDQIAFQTNILSLNAAVEAAKAGESGKGFSVVAGEVRNLANRSAEAAKEIKELVESATYKTNEGKNISNDMKDGYALLNEKINKTIEIISEISISSKEQESGIVQINDAVNALDQETQQNATTASNAKDISLATQELAAEILEYTDKKEFLNKNKVSSKNLTKLNYNSQDLNSVDRSYEKTKNSDFNSKAEDEWESF